MRSRVQFFACALTLFHKKVFTLSDGGNTKNQVPFVHKMAYTLLDRDNATTVSEFQFNVDRYSCR